MKTKMTIRPVMVEDKEKLFSLVKQRGTFNEKDIEIAIEVLEDTLFFPEREEYYALCAVNSNDALAGFISFGPIPMTDGCYDLYWIVVDEKYSRNGVGKKLLDAMEEYVIKNSGRRIYIDTSSTPPYAAARAFYEKHGFHLIAELADFYRRGDHKMIYMKELVETQKMSAS